MSMDLTGITNQNEYYTNHYFSSIFEGNASETISKWRASAKESEEIKTPWAMLREAARQYYPIHDRFLRSKFDMQTLANIKTLADLYLKALGYPEGKPDVVEIDDSTKVPVYLELTKPSGAPALWVLLATSSDKEAAILDKYSFDASYITDEGQYSVPQEALTEVTNEDLVTKILFGQTEPPRFILLIGMNQIALIDRNKWNEKRYLQFELEDIFSRHEETTLQAMAVLLHRTSLCPEEGTALLDELDANSQKHAAGVSQDLKFALRECIEILGNEVLYDMKERQGRNLEENPVDAAELTLECLRYMYRMLFVLFIEARPELGYAPIQNITYKSGYSLDNLRDIADDIRDDVTEVGSGYFLHETLSKLYELIYNGYPETEEDLLKYSEEESLHDMFVIAPLKAHIFDPEYTKMITNAKLRNSCMLRIIDKMSLTKETGRRNERRGRISYANLGINQLGSVYEALLSYRGFIAEHTLFEVKRAGDRFDELNVGYFVAEEELDQYTEDERVRYEHDDPDGRYKAGDLRKYEKGTFIYRLAGREREKSASFYTPEVLTKCLVKYALKELLKDKSADEILHLTICEPAMGSAAFLNEAITQLAEAYLDKKQKERGELIPAGDRLKELQKVKMYMADRNVYGIDLNPVAVELAEVSLWLNTIHEGGFVPWFGTQLVNGNSLIGARRQVYRTDALTTTSRGLHWYENAPEKLPFDKKRMPKTQVYHFLMGDPGMCKYTDSVIKSLEPDNIRKMNDWNKNFTKPYDEDEIVTLLRLSSVVDKLWDAQIKLRQEVEAKTQDKLSVYGYEDDAEDSHTTIRQKDQILSELYKSEHMKNAGPYARLKFAMDYWCSLWFWPIDKADLLPSRSEFLFDMSLILEGTTGSVRILDATDDKRELKGQFSMFPSEMQHMAMDITNTYGSETIVDIPALRKQNPRLDLAARIAEENHFMHWELEFANLFAERGGFDLIIGNPPWIKITWEEKGVLSDGQPLFAVRNLTANQTTQKRGEVLLNSHMRELYFNEYESIAAQQNYVNSMQNYASLKGLQGNLYECFLPQSWKFCNKEGVFALIHPESVFNDSKGVNIRKELNQRLRKHFRFSNALRLFTDVHTSREFGLNVYCNKPSGSFDQIVNLYAVSTVDECYENEDRAPVYIRDKDGKRNLKGQHSRITTITRNELKMFARIMDDNDDWESARLMSVHAEQLLDILKKFEAQGCRLAELDSRLAVSMLWDETNAQNDGTIERCVHFGEPMSTILSGAHIGTANPLFNCSNCNCSGNNDNTSIDLSLIPDNYVQRCNYQPSCEINEYISRVPITPWGNKYTENYRIVARKMVDIEGERTLMPALISKYIGHTNGIIGFAFADIKTCAIMLGAFCSLPYDFFIKLCGKGNLQMNTAGMLPLISVDHVLAGEIICRACKLNCLTSNYSEFWKSVYEEGFKSIIWSKDDDRLKKEAFEQLSIQWVHETPARDAYSRRQLMVELDVLISMTLGMTLEQLLSAYRIQFPILQQHEKDTYYDAEGKIVYAKNNALTGVGFSRQEFEGTDAVQPSVRGDAPWDGIMKNAPAGYVFSRTITDDTMPGGPVERTIEYVAPFDRCDREQDYETAWKFFEHKYGGNK